MPRPVPKVNEDELPERWGDIDDAIFDARIRRGMTWKQVGEHVNLSFSQCRKRFYAKIAKIEPAEIAEYRTEETFKLDERDQRALSVFMTAMLGTPLRHNGKIVYQTVDDEPRAVMQRDLTAALGALREMDRVARSRYLLLGLQAPMRIEIADITEPSANLEVELERFLEGLMHDNAGSGADLAGGTSPTAPA